jgi:hypothetical protein
VSGSRLDSIDLVRVSYMPETIGLRETHGKESGSEDDH